MPIDKDQLLRYRSEAETILNSTYTRIDMPGETELARRIIELTNEIFNLKRLMLKDYNCQLYKEAIDVTD